ncbi:MAG TPA: TadE/TadG family type IV pilus assembly protein [Bradyrhizobium sp.]|nr:TadE/TadG family type IV pilus assembly protein [Bradyrhizobium sp.]
MSGVSIFSRVRAAASRFAGAEQGNIAVIFAIAAVPLISFVGAAIDYSRANAARTAMQAALDSTSLMLSKDLTDGLIAPSDVNAKAQAYFKALYTNPNAKSVTVNATYTMGSSSAASTVLVNGTGSINTDFMKVAGFPNINFDSSSTATWGNTRMRVAMVLDNTGSMDQNGKMAAMQKAATDMITDLSNYSKKTGDVYISIVPFAKDVNVGADKVNASWINWSDWLAEPPILKNNKSTTFQAAKAGSDCPFTNYTHGFGCMDRPATLSGANNTSTIPSSGTYAGYICPGLDSGQISPGKANIYYNGCYTTATGKKASCTVNGVTFGADRCSCSNPGNNNNVCHYWRGDDNTAAMAAAAPALSTWTGCINDRDQDYDTTNVAPGSSDASPSTKFYAEQWSQCLDSTVTPMSDQWQTLKDQINAMTASGNTNQAVGLAWGWQSLSTDNGPIQAPPKDATYAYKDYIVLLSDGLNTQNRWSASQSSIDARQQILCQNIKNDKLHPITVFTIQVNINNADGQSQVLKDCATPDGSFQMITSATQTSGAFKSILTQISKLRVAK